MKLVKHISNLGYGSRKEVTAMFREGRITDAAGEVLYADDATTHDNIHVDDEPLDPPSGMLLILHKPAGYTCSRQDDPDVLLWPHRLPRCPCWQSAHISPIGSDPPNSGTQRSSGHADSKHYRCRTYGRGLG